MVSQIRVMLTLSAKQEPLFSIYNAIGKDSFTSVCKACVKAPYDPVAAAMVKTAFQGLGNFKKMRGRATVTVVFTKSDGTAFKAIGLVAPSERSAFVLSMMRAAVGFSSVLQCHGLPPATVSTDAPPVTIYPSFSLPRQESLDFANLSPNFENEDDAAVAQAFDQKRTRRKIDANPKQSAEDNGQAVVRTKNPPEPEAEENSKTAEAPFDTNKTKNDEPLNVAAFSEPKEEPDDILSMLEAMM